VLTDSSFHHFINLNVVGDPCAGTEELNGLVTHKEELAAFYRNVALWLAIPRTLSSRWGIGSISGSSTLKCTDSVAWRCVDSKDSNTLTHMDLIALSYSFEPQVLPSILGAALGLK
jgi:hypothetical protein